MFSINSSLQYSNKTQTENRTPSSQHRKSDFTTSSKKNSTMPLNKSHVQYVLTQFDGGVPPHQILIGLQYRAFLPSITIATIERCLRDNGRVLNDQQAGSATQGNQSLGIGWASHFLPPANQGVPGPSAATQGSGQFSTGSAMGTFTIADDHFVGPGRTMRWDSEADDFILAAYIAGMSGDEIWTKLRSNGYDIARAQVVISLFQQGVQVQRAENPKRH